MKRPSFNEIRSTSAAQAEVAWWEGARLKTLRARFNCQRDWYGNATLSSAGAAGLGLARCRLIRGSQTCRSLNGADPYLHTNDNLLVRGLEPSLVVDASAVAIDTRCTTAVAHRALLRPLRPHLDRVRAEIDAQLRDPERTRQAEGVLHAAEEVARGRRAAKLVARVDEELLPYLLDHGLTEEQWVEWYRLAVVQGVMGS